MTAYSAVVTTGIYCSPRPTCGARPNGDNVRTFSTAAAAEAAGFRACLRCRPYRLPGSVPWDAPELVCRAVRLILGGALDEGSEAELGQRLGLSGRHLRRLFNDHLGLTPDQLARSRRAHFARRLLDDTDLPVTDVAFASGFGSLRQFNRTMTEVFRFPPQDLRRRRRKADRLVTDGGTTLRLPFDPPYDWPAMLAALAARAIPGVEHVDASGYRRTITLDGGPGLLEVDTGGADHLLLRAHLPYWEGLIHLVERLRSLLAMDREPAARVPGEWGSTEAGVRAALGRHHAAAEERELIGRLATTFGTPVPGLPFGLTHTFPSAEALRDADLADCGLPPETVEEVRRVSGSGRSERAGALTFAP